MRIRITEQYFWNVVFLIFFLILIFLASVILESESRKPFDEISLSDFVLITLASWRLVRLVVYDKIFAFFREQFYDAIEDHGVAMLLCDAAVQPQGGSRAQQPLGRVLLRQDPARPRPYDDLPHGEAGVVVQRRHQ